MPNAVAELAKQTEFLSPSEMMELAMLLISQAQVAIEKLENGQQSSDQNKRDARARALRRMNQHPLPVTAPRYTRDELHERS